MIQTWSLQKFLRLTKKGWNAYNSYIWLWQSKFFTYIISQSTDRPLAVDQCSANNQWSTGRLTVSRGICWWSVDMSADISLIRWLICRPTHLDLYIGRHIDIYIGRHLDRHISQASVDKSANISIDMLVDMGTNILLEGCTKYTWSHLTTSKAENLCN